MNDQADKTQGEKAGPGFKAFATKRIIVAAALIIAVVWALGIGLNRLGGSDEARQEGPPPQTQMEHQGSPSTSESGALASVSEGPQAGHQVAAASPSEEAAGKTGQTGSRGPHPETAAVESIQGPQKTDPTSAQGHAPRAGTLDETAPHDQQTETESVSIVRPRGVAFVEAVIQPIDYELNKRFWGWRPNDIINFTDNINNFQLGVLEVTRRTTIMLSERISRTGSTDRLNPHLEDAANWLMITATRYWFPSPESKYKECIKELEAYKQELIKGSGTFYIRADNLIPLLASYEDLLGSCDENLVKQKNEDGTDVSIFKADDYFFYAKGVASAMATILEAVHHDFLPTLENRHGAELIHHALLSCRQASALSPLLITDADWDGIIANHRANMAAPISHARYYIGQLIKTLST